MHVATLDRRPESMMCASCDIYKHDMSSNYQTTSTETVVYSYSYLDFKSFFSILAAYLDLNPCY